MFDSPLYPFLRSSAGPRPTGAKLALKSVHVWGVRIRLQVALRARDLALFELALDCKLRLGSTGGAGPIRRHLQQGRRR